MKKSAHDIIRTLQVTEKGSALLTQNKYMFDVARNANRIEIRHAVEELFRVRVTKVNTMNYRGKRKPERSMRRYGKRADWKRAIGTLAQGQEIPLT